MNFKIKIAIDFDDGGYIVFVDGIPGLEGHGDTEVQAIMDFFNNYDKFKDKEYFEPLILKTLKEKYEMMVENEDQIR